MKRLLSICAIALAGLPLVACGDDDEDEPTSPAVSIETPTAETTTTPTTPAEEATGTAPPDGTTETAPPGGDGSAAGGASEKRGKRKGPGPGGGEKADLPKCSEVGEGPAPCLRPDGTVRVPEPL